MAGNVQWFGADVVAKIKQDVDSRALSAANHLANRIKESIDRPNPTGRDPSRPGEYPKKVSGELQASIVVQESETGTGYAVGTTLEYGKFLELGTSKMSPRPWLSKALREYASEIAKIFSSGARIGAAKANTGAGKAKALRARAKQDRRNAVKRANRRNRYQHFESGGLGGLGIGGGLKGGL